MAKAVLGIIGGSGIYDLPGLENAREEAIKSPWGEPSAPVRHGTIAGLPIVFLPRHDKGHRLSPSDINYRANIDVLKRAGVTDLISLSACGSFKEELPPGTFVLVDQFVDRTHKRESSFFGKGCVAHVSMAHPVSPRLRIHLAAAAEAEGIAIARGGTYVCMEGPQFSTLAESMTYKTSGYSVIGMTNMPEAKLAREAEICYATVAMVTDFDCWHPDHDAVTVQDIIRVLGSNADKAKALVARLAKDFPRQHEACPIGSDRALDTALITAPEARDPELLKKLDAVAGRVLGTEGGNGDRRAMKVDGKHFRSIWRATDGWSVGAIDQRRLPHEFVIARLTNCAEAAEAIRSMLVRGAPLIGATAAYGMALAMRDDKSDAAIDRAYQMLIATRPTAINLKWALDEMRRMLQPLPPSARSDAAYARADDIAEEDVAINQGIAKNGLALIEAIAAKKPGEAVNVLTHCNAGWLATVDWGTATAPIYLAHDRGIKVHVWVDETRPRNQGASLTAWELGHHGVRAYRDPRQHRRPSDAASARSISPSSAPTASPPMATSATRSEPI